MQYRVIIFEIWNINKEAYWSKTTVVAAPDSSICQESSCSEYSILSVWWIVCNLAQMWQQLALLVNEHWCTLVQGKDDNIFAHDTKALCSVACIRQTESYSRVVIHSHPGACPLWYGLRLSIYRLRSGRRLRHRPLLKKKFWEWLAALRHLAGKKNVRQSIACYTAQCTKPAHSCL